jgi:hypothetical protein
VPAAQWRTVRPARRSMRAKWLLLRSSSLSASRNSSAASARGGAAMFPAGLGQTSSCAWRWAAGQVLPGWRPRYHNHGHLPAAAPIERLQAGEGERAAALSGLKTKPRRPTCRPTFRSDNHSFRPGRTFVPGLAKKSATLHSSALQIAGTIPRQHALAWRVRARLDRTPQIRF